MDLLEDRVSHQQQALFEGDYLLLREEETDLISCIKTISSPVFHKLVAYRTLTGRLNVKERSDW